MTNHCLSLAGHFPAVATQEAPIQKKGMSDHDKRIQSHKCRQKCDCHFHQIISALVAFFPAPLGEAANFTPMGVFNERYQVSVLNLFSFLCCNRWHGRKILQEAKPVGYVPCASSLQNNTLKCLWHFPLISQLSLLSFLLCFPVHTRIHTIFLRFVYCSYGSFFIEIITLINTNC